MKHKIRAWPVSQTRRLIHNRVFDVTARHSRSPLNGREHEFYVVECTDWVNVIPLLADGRVVMIRQYRHGRQEITLEVPGGMVDPEDGDPSVAAGRELLEETGYRAGKVEPIGSIAPNPAILDNLCHSYVATELEFHGALELDSTEDIEVVKIPLQQVPGLIREGQISHSLVVVAFTHFFGLGSR